MLYGEDLLKDGAFMCIMESSHLVLPFYRFWVGLNFRNILIRAFFRHIMISSLLGIL